MIKTVLLIGIWLASSFVYAGISEKDVIKDWEETQGRYPQTSVFEKVDERLYKLNNTGFGYEGLVKIKNVIIESGAGKYGTTADIVVQLDKNEGELFKEFGRSYSRWQQTNSLVYDMDHDKWVRYRDIGFGSSKCTKNKKQSQPLLAQLLVATFPILLIVAIFMAFYRVMYRSAGGKNINQAILESNLEIAKELKRIADYVEKRG